MLGGSISTLRVTGDPTKGDPRGEAPRPRPPPPSFTGVIFVTGNEDLPLATQRRVESIASVDCPSPSLDRIYQLCLWSAIFFAIFLRLPPNKFLRKGDVKGCGSRCVEDGRRLIRTIIARQQPSRPVRRLFLCLSDSGQHYRLRLDLEAASNVTRCLRQATLLRVHYSNI